MTFTRRAWGLFVVLVMTCALIAVPRQEARADQRYRFFHFNMCGNKCNLGDHGPVVRAVRRSIMDFRPAAVSLNEVCRSQYRAIRRQIAARGFRMEGRWLQTKGRNNDCRGNDYGIAVLSRRPITDRDRFRLSRAVNGETRKLLCVKARLVRATRICTTHIITNNHPNLQVRQIKKVTRKVNAYVAKRRPVVLMGDFNLPPTANTLDRLYTRAHGGDAFGRFQEVDEGRSKCRCGESTHGDSKIDYIFVSARHWRRPWGNATHTTDLPFPYHFDHDPLRGKATLNS